MIRARYTAVKKEISVRLENVFAWRRKKSNTLVIEQNTRSRAGDLEIQAMSSCQSSDFASKDRGIDKSLALAKTCPAGVCALGRLSF